MPIENEIEERLMLSIDQRRLVLLSGAGLSMASPSNLPSASDLAEECWNKYNRSVTTPLPDTFKNDLEELAKYFLTRGLFDQFIDVIVPWDYFHSDHNLGHDLPPNGVPLIEGKSLAKIMQIMQEIRYEKETIYRRADPRDTEGIRSRHADAGIVPQIRHK